ncbi:hypothetical protein DWF00_03300 [Bosea caraganae]|uniref:Uncharacterized protein n=1 Tax=Bosea caraganae TaxID=2763117 RepID=A0A370L672_9HYPH|nr:hypothetical protein [Bosea caraganae]RDJ24125.1 hypothetical protein DWE98_14530 [Bosea caraganae]RDJ30167.1 hypothetical protein DWF00_03300 [Bosea caraganae]
MFYRSVFVAVAIAASSVWAHSALAEVNVLKQAPDGVVEECRSRLAQSGPWSQPFWSCIRAQGFNAVEYDGRIAYQHDGQRF